MSRPAFGISKSGVRVRNQRVSNPDVSGHYLAYESPMVIDARKKPSLPEELIVRDDFGKLVDRRWREYFPKGLESVPSA